MEKPNLKCPDVFFQKEIFLNNGRVALLGDKRGTLACWSDDFLVEADEKDLDAVEAHLMKRLEEDMLARIGGISSGEAGFLEASVAV